MSQVDAGKYLISAKRYISLARWKLNKLVVECDASGWDSYSSEYNDEIRPAYEKLIEICELLHI